MGLFDGKQNQLVAHAAKLEAAVEYLTSENSHLRKQVEKLQEALFAKEAPEAYTQMKNDEWAMKYTSPISNEDMEKRKKENDIMKRLILETERPLFETEDDLRSALSAVVGAPQSQPLHGNSES